MHYTRQMIIDSVADDFWYGPVNPSDDALWLACLERVSYAHAEGYSTPSVMDPKKTVAAIRKQINVSYINGPQTVEV